MCRPNLGDIWKVRGSCTILDKVGSLCLCLPATAELVRTSEFCMAYSETPDMSAIQSIVDVDEGSGQPACKKFKRENGEEDKDVDIGTPLLLS